MEPAWIIQKRKQHTARLNFNIDFDIQPGFLITMSDGNITKEHIVAYIEVISMNINSETVFRRSECWN